MLADRSIRMTTRSSWLIATLRMGLARAKIAAASTISCSSSSRFLRNFWNG
jgi:hypothetical protein